MYRTDHHVCGGDESRERSAENTTTGPYGLRTLRKTEQEGQSDLFFILKVPLFYLKFLRFHSFVEVTYPNYDSPERFVMAK